MKLLFSSLVFVLFLTACGRHDSAAPLVAAPNAGIQADADMVADGQPFSAMIQQTEKMFLNCPEGVDYSRPTKVLYFSDGHDSFIYALDRSQVGGDDLVLADEDALVKKAIYTHTQRAFDETLGDLVVALFTLPTTTKLEDNYHHPYQFADLALVAFRCKSDVEGSTLELEDRYLTFAPRKSIKIYDADTTAPDSLVVWEADDKSLVLKAVDELALPDVNLPKLGWGDSLTSLKNVAAYPLNTYTATQDSLLGTTALVRSAMDQKYASEYLAKMANADKSLSDLEGQQPGNFITKFLHKNKTASVMKEREGLQKTEDQRVTKMMNELNLFNP